MKNFFNSIKNESKENQKIFARAELIQNVTEDLMIAMEDLKISKAGLAKKLGKTKSYITQVLSGSRNMTLSSLSDLCFELDIKPEIKIIPEEQQLDFVNFENSHEIYWQKEDNFSSSFVEFEFSKQKVINLENHPDFTYRKSAA